MSEYSHGIVAKAPGCISCIILFVLASIIDIVIRQTMANLAENHQILMRFDLEVETDILSLIIGICEGSIIGVIFGRKAVTRWQFKWIVQIIFCIVMISTISYSAIMVLHRYQYEDEVALSVLIVFAKESFIICCIGWLYVANSRSVL